MTTELDKWQQELQRITELAKTQVNDDLFRAYRSMLRDIKASVADYLDRYDELSFSKRLEVEMQLNTAKQIEETIVAQYSEVNTTIKRYGKKQAEQGYNGVWYALEGAENITLDLPLLSQKYIETLVNQKVDGKTFSQRLYRHRSRLAKETTNALLNGAAQGKGYAEIAKQINELTEASYKQALRIAITEGGRAQSQATQKGYEESEKKGVDLEKEWLATLDAKTRSSHQHLDGQRVGIKEKFESHGKHADGPRMFGDAGLDINCRCTTIPIVDGVAPELRRDNETGENIAFQSYEDWANSKGIGATETTTKKIKTSKELFDSLDMTKATHEDIINLGKQIADEYKIKEFIGQQDKIAEVFSNFRDMGGEIDKATWAKGSKKAAKDRLAEAFSYYPKAWVKKLNESGRQLFAGSNKRGFFTQYLTDARGHLKTNVEGNRTDYFTIFLSDSYTVAYHEIGHLMEFLNPDIVRIEKAFVEARTAGEELTRLSTLFPGWGYSVRETTKKDDFISPYIGKEYKNATEVLSMGLESLFVGSKHVQKIEDGKRVTKGILDDEEFLNLIVGLIAKG